MRMRVFSAFALAAMLCLAPTAAIAAIPANDPGSGSGYTPDEPTEPTLAGSVAAAECEGDVPWITFSVVLTDPDDQATSQTATLVLSDGSNSTTIVLGELVDGQLDGRVLWPGASVDAAGNPTGWPGWAFVDGEWVETDGNFAWTRGDISATIEVNPELAVPLSYPPATPVCAALPPLISSDSPGGLGNPGNPETAGLLPATGLGASMLPVGIVGAVLAVAGLTLVAVRRRHRSNG